MVFETIQELLYILNDVKGDIYIAGAGYLGRIYGKYLTLHNISWNGFLDIKHTGSSIDGKPIYSYEYGKNDREAYVVVSSYFYLDEILVHLAELMISKEHIFAPKNLSIPEGMLKEIHSLSFHVKQFQGRHLNERCFIIGNGPSLQIDDLEKIKSEVSFASNSIYALYQGTDWRPTYYGVTDFVAVSRLIETNHIKTVLSGGSILFFPVILFEYFFSGNCLTDDMYFLSSEEGIENDRTISFSDDIEKIVYTGATVTYFLMQIAVYMGFKELYLLGMDFSYSVECKIDGNQIERNISNHHPIIEEEERRNYYSPVYERYGYTYIANIDKQLWGYQATKRYADAKGIKIYNATRGGNLEVFERIEFDEVI